LHVYLCSVVHTNLHGVQVVTQRQQVKWEFEPFFCWHLELFIAYLIWIYYTGPRIRVWYFLKV
jgi:hypothetical protein